MYCVNGQKPFYQTLSEARKAVIDSGVTDGTPYGDGIIVAIVMTDSGEGVGAVMRAEWAPRDCYFWAPKDGGMIREIYPDGELVKDSEGMLRSKKSGKKYYLNTKDHGILEFDDPNELARVFINLTKMDGVGSGMFLPIYTVSDDNVKVIGHVATQPHGCILEIEGTVRDVDRSGRVGKVRKDLVWDYNNNCLNIMVQRRR